MLKKQIFLKRLKIIVFLGTLAFSALSCEDSQADKTATVYVKETSGGYQLMRNNQPYYIKGAAAQPEFLEELRDAGGNTARVYDTINLQETLDKAYDLDLAVVVDIPLPTFKYNPEFYEDQQLFTNMRERIEKLVKKHKEHPALLYWNLGNEIEYPFFYKRTDFFKNFNDLIATIHKIDPEHPVSSSEPAGSRRRLLSMQLRSPQLDFISLNGFGTLTGLLKSFKSISLIWDGPYVISEWGVNGPWEETATAWGAPIEPTSTKKTEILRQRYHSEVIQDPNCLGSFFFYWGKKHERTQTWFSVFNREKAKSEAYYEVSRIWNDSAVSFDGAKLKYALLNEKGAADNIMLSAGEEAHAEVIFQQNMPDSAQVNWEIREEAWLNPLQEPPLINVPFLESSPSNLVFKTPEKEGPYRIFYYITDKKNNFATTNIPFYVLKEKDEE